MNSRAEQKLKTRKSIIESALTLSAEKNFFALSLREVTRHAGIAPATFYRHFDDMNELGLVLVDEVGLTLRHLMRKARKRVKAKGTVVRTSIETFMEFLYENPNLFRLLSGDRGGGPKVFRDALRKEKHRFIEELIEDLNRDSEQEAPPLALIPEVADLMVNQVFNGGLDAIDLPESERAVLSEKLINQLRIALYGARAIAARDRSHHS